MRKPMSRAQSGIYPAAYLFDCIANLQSGRWAKNCRQNIRRGIIPDG